MASELTQANEVSSYSSTTTTTTKTVQVWRALLNWLDFFFQIFIQILKALGHYPLLFSSSSSSSSSFNVSFKSLPAVELPEHDSSAAVEISDSPDSDSDDEPLHKLTVVLDLDETFICAYESASLSGIVRTQATEGGLRWIELECISSKPSVEDFNIFTY